MKNNKKLVQMKQVGNKIKFNLLDRYFVLQILPQMGKSETLLASRQVRDKIKITEDELKSFEITNVSSGDIAWNKKGEASVFAYEFTEIEKLLLQKCLYDADSKSCIPEICLDFYLLNK